MSARCDSIFAPVLWAILLLGLTAATGCGHKAAAPKAPATAPTLHAPKHHEAPAPDATESTPPMASAPGIHVDPKAKVIWSQTGYASWYGPNYHHKKAANGEIYDQNEMTAAHNTLPLNSIVRVVNLKNNRATVVRITDRGPFVGDRIIDLSVASAKAIDIYIHGTAPVRLDVLEAPHPIDTGGRWCVQIGAFSSQQPALQLKQHLIKRYPGAQVLQFPGPTGYWVRIRPPQDDKEKARQIFEGIHVDEGAAFMVRMD